MTALEEKIFESHIKSWLWCRYIDDIFLIWDHGENELKQFIEKLSEFHPTRKFTCGYSWERIHFLDVQVILENNEISTDLYVKETDIHQYSTNRRVTHAIVLSQFLTVKLYDSTEYVQIISFTKTVVTS